MMKMLLKLLPLLLVAVLACSKQPTDAAKEKKAVVWPFDPPSTEPLDAFTVNERIGRGFNLGNALEAASEEAGGMVIKDEYLKIIADAGFYSIRLPVSWSLHSENAPPYLIDAAFFERVDHVVQTALGNGLTVVLNEHHFDELNDDPVAHREWLLKLWQQISTHYADYPDNLIFEILNEPHGAFNDDASLWNKLAQDALDIIRIKNPYRIVVVGPVSWNSIHSLDSMSLPENDRGLIVTVHYYDPFQFTHQGASWVGDQSMNWLGTTWLGSPDEHNAVNSAFDAAAQWASEHNRPLYLGEFGSYSTADMNSRYRWTDYVARSAEKRGISWTYWEFGAGFGAYDRDKNEWRPLLLKALMPE